MCTRHFDQTQSLQCLCAVVVLHNTSESITFTFFVFSLCVCVMMALWLKDNKKNRQRNIRFSVEICRTSFLRN